MRPRSLHIHSIRLAAFAACLFLLWTAAATASTMYLMSGNRRLPDRFAPIHTARGFVVPVDLATLFGAEVYKEQGDWIVRRGSQVVRFKPGVAVAQVGERQSELPSAPIELDGDLYVPLRFLGDFMGLKISIVGNTLDITTWSPLGMNRGSGVSEFVPVFPPTALEVDEPGPAGAQGVNASLMLPSPVELPPASFAPDLSGSRGNEDALERPSRVAEAIARLLGTLGTSPDEKHVWSALERSTGLSLRAVNNQGAWEYRFSGAPVEGATTALLVDPPRLVVDLPGVRGAAPEPYLPPDPVVKRIRAVDRDGSLRLVFDLADGVGHRIDQVGDEARLVIFRPLSVVSVDAGSKGGRIRLDVPGNTPYKISRLTQPERVVLDLYDTSLVAGPITVGPLGGPVTQVRAAQFQPDITRIVLDVAADTTVEVSPAQGGLTVAYGDHVGTVAYRVLGSREFHIGVNAPPDAQVALYRLFYPDRLVMDVKGAQLSAPLQDEVFLEGPVSRLRVSQFDATTVRVVADLRYHVRYMVRQEGERRVLVMEQPLLTGRTLTVDAGHGGHDGGAEGVRLGALEKEINLDIARRLQRLLEGAEATVHMTRVDDTFIDLWARADLANETKSDVLVSVHANSAPPDNTTAKGTETFVRMGEPLSERLGAAIQRSLTSALGTVDRGVRPNRYLVVRRATMPAALVEVAFLADPDEEALLMEEWYRERAAEGIFNGLLRYFYPEDKLESGPAVEGASSAPWRTLKEVISPGVATASS